MKKLLATVLAVITTLSIIVPTFGMIPFQDVNSLSKVDAVEAIWDRFENTEKEPVLTFIPPYPPGGYGTLLDDTGVYIGVNYADVPGAVPPLLRPWWKTQLDNNIIGLIPIP